MELVKNISLQLKDIKFSYRENNILNSITIDMNQGNLIGIIGPNGAGKTTLLKCILGLLSPSEGTISINGKNIKSISSEEKAHIIGYVPQKDNTAFSIPLYEAVLLGRRPYINYSVSRNDLKIVDDLLQKLDLIKLAQRPINQLSGGEKQKVFIARALAQETSILLLDEPTSALDLKHQVEVLSILKNQVKEHGKLVIVVMHDINLASRYADALIMLKKGQIYSFGKPEDVITSKNLRDVYEVDAHIHWSEFGPQIEGVNPI